ncbi:MAG: sulfate adenylyltransferase [Rhodospirillaceae bacterium]|jgi:2-oxo-3-hexenedioate decarboxylase/2-keto-4-pentenoate hydratase|nr:sulfate adenylyltransferase [Rhodospirillaceae bacterium]MBT5945575.1 sulfate adenylyltransferase [Rhodospirillaceae bacterium]MBT6403801.1 sulfate adenylyltransferase [Rhodospirillaceae bacterium]MBT6536156.1 sulfate adenylyltransferase [Rhodospirillaceae bacterium]MBT7360584.1 sulfate adenylyltransferase [Rhodospirillaceae bacterium]
MDLTAINQAATVIAENRLNRTKLDSLPAEYRPQDLDDAYAVQERHNVILGERGLGNLVGYKIGCTTPVMQAYMNIHEPSYGEVFDTTVHHNHADLVFANFVNPGVETEIAVTLSVDMPAEGGPYTRDSVRDAVGAAMISIELVEARYRNYRELDTPTMAADNFFNAAVVLGDPVADWHGLDLATAEGTILLNGELLGTGLGSLIMGHPLEALAWLANRLAERGRHLEAGEFVTLGSVIATHWVSQGDRIDHSIPGLGSVSISFA